MICRQPETLRATITQHITNDKIGDNAKDGNTGKMMNERFSNLYPADEKLRRREKTSADEKSSTRLQIV